MNGISFYSKYFNCVQSKADKDYAIDDLFMEQTISNKSRKNNEMQQAIDKQKKTDKALDECYWCLTNNRIKKHLIISTSSKVSVTRNKDIRCKKRIVNIDIFCCSVTFAFLIFNLLPKDIV